jgi:hypothetical protein
MKLPSRKQAEAFLAEGAEMNPGPWVLHSRLAAQAAEAIAAYHPELDPDCAYILGLLHDIGRREGVFKMRHSIDGYNFLDQQGYLDVARVCITHSFLLQDINLYVGENDCTPAEERFLIEYLANIDYNLYDRLVQLSDTLALPTGFCLVETRLVDVALRYGINQYTLPRWRSFFKIKQQFEDAIGQSIYEVLPGEVEHSFSFLV